MIARVLGWVGSGLGAAGAMTADLLWPRTCAACDRGSLLAAAAPGGLCAVCSETLFPLWPRPAVPTCRRCAAPQAQPAGARGCADCRRLDPALRRVRAAFAYEGALPIALQRLKWQGRDDLAGPLGALLAPLLKDAAVLDRCDVVTAVPLHPSRLRERGYNQAALLLQAGLAACRGARRLAVGSGWLVRQLATPPARAEGAQARLRRVAGAFVVPPRHAARVHGRRVLLVDDVVTTGATVSACAAALHVAGAAHVEAVALLRAASPQ